MGDSPLSIVASVTGILTFIAAMFGFIYVRYQISSSGRQESTSIFESVTASIIDTSALQQTMLQAESEHDFGSDLKRALIAELYVIQIEILRLYAGSGFCGLMVDLKPSSQNDEHMRSWEDIIQATEQDLDVAQRRHGRINSFLRSRKVSAQVFPAEHALLGVWSSVNVFINLGANSTLMYWYMIRKSVLEKVKKRKILQSRLLFYEVSNANLVSQKLLRENETLKSDLHELRTLTLQIFNLRHNTQNQSNKSSGSGDNGADGIKLAEAHEPQEGSAIAAG